MTFDAAEIEALGWRQGSVLGPKLFEDARQSHPLGVHVQFGDLLIVVSHDCDVVNFSLDKEPVVEILLAKQISKTDKQQEFGKNPRTLHVELDGETILSCRVHERWTVARSLLTQEGPAQQLPKKQKRLIAEWLAKRYIRPAFPSSFDKRWHRNGLKAWSTTLQRHSEYIQGIFLRLNTDEELPPEIPYQVAFIVAVPAETVGAPGWAELKDAISRDIEKFWAQFSPSIDCREVEVLGAHEITVEALTLYERFDVDWMSFADGTPTIPPAADLRE